MYQTRHTDMESTDTQVYVKGSQMDWESVGPGLKRKVLGYDAGLMLVHVDFEEGAVGQLHHHPHRQVSYVESGRFEVQVNGRKEVLEAGDSFFIPPDVEHGAVALEAGRLLDVFAPAREDFVEDLTSE